MNKTEFAHALVAQESIEREQDAAAVLDALASIIWHALEHGEEVSWPGVGRFAVDAAPRRRRAVTFEPATELEVAVNRHHVTA